MPKTLCIYHANCADGLLAAWAVHKALGPEVEFVAGRYGRQLQDRYDFSNRDVLFVDFSAPLADLRDIATSARSVLVLDHHKTAQEDLAELSEPPTPHNYQRWCSLFSPSEPQPPIFPNLAAIFDLTRSGAGIAWDYLHPGKPRPRIIDLVEDRDLWRFRFGDETRAFHAVLASYEWTDLPGMFKRLDEWSKYANHDWYLQETTRVGSRYVYWTRLLDEGRAILRAQSRAVASAVAASRRTIKIAGHMVPCANVPPGMASEAGELLCKLPALFCGMDSYFTDNDRNIRPLFSATYYDNADGKRHFSLRSPEGGADVGKIAKKMAALFTDYAAASLPYVAIEKFRGKTWTGGGHEHAAGFDAPLGWNGE